MASKPKLKYDIEDMKKAVSAVNKKEKNVYQASKLYQVPRSSLQNIVDGKATLGNTKFGPKPALGDHEPLLVHWIEAMSQRGFPITTQNLLASVGKIAKEMGVDQLFNGNPGKKWFKLFMKRNPSIAKRTVEKVTKSRSLVTKTHILNCSIVQ
ncbi:tigger transposable element-derived protein 6-like [Aphis craccivora]|uniref:Tigger transposable element-derived protein 6-like n=1 Tax=Aphis craccivora TaxID=307492 RepID=A0A6G0VL93_APHCR|nr:tigger transposable element-derived protein 6-like [Aphis craccivora]